jgi:hypothetical protein
MVIDILTELLSALQMISSVQLKEFVEANPKLVTRKESQTYPGLFVLKYHRRVFYDNLWNDILRECRGLVVDADYNIVIYPFTKIYNRFENGADMDRDDLVQSIVKVNGFMAVVTIIDGKPVVSTTGSLDSPYVDMAKHMLVNFIGEYLPYTWSKAFELLNYTFIFEIVHPDDPHVVVEEPGAYLIGARELNTQKLMSEECLDKFAYDFDLARPDWFYHKFSEAVKHVKRVKHEGFVIRRVSDDYTLKIKSPFYLMTKFFGRVNNDKLLKILGNPQWKSQFDMDEEYYPIFEFLTSIKDSYIIMDEQQKMETVRNFIESTIYK